MKFQRFQLYGFAQHEEIDLEFRHGEPNLIIGPNEAGKSNLMTALTGTIFGLEKPEQYTPWHGEPVMTGRLQFQAGKDQIEIERRFLEQQVDVHLNEELIYSGRGLVNRNTAEDQRYRSLLHEWIGFTEHDVFQRTVFVGQDQVQDHGLGSFASQFKRLISGTREANYETAISDLESKLDTLIKLPGKRNNRRREDLQDELKDLEQRYQHAEEVQRRVVTLIQEERTLRESLETVRKKRDRYRALVDNYTELQQVTTQENQSRLAWNDLNEQVERLTRAREQWLKQEEKRDRLKIPGDPDPEEVNDLSRDIERLEPRVKYLEEALERNREINDTREFLESELERFRFPGKVEAAEVLNVARQLSQAEQLVAERTQLLEEKQRESVPLPRQSDGLRHALFVVAALILIGAVLLGFFVDTLFFGGVAIALAVLIAGFVADRGTEHQVQQNEEHTRQLMEMREQLQAAVDRLKEVQAHRNKLLAASKVETLHDLFYRAREFQATEDRLHSLPAPEDVSEQELHESTTKLATCHRRRDHLLRVSGHEDLDALYRQAREYWETVRVMEQMEEVDPKQIETLTERRTAAQQEAVIARQTKQRILRLYPELGEISADEISEYREIADQGDKEVQDLERRLYQITVNRQHLGHDTEDAGELRLRIHEIRDQIAHIGRLAEAHQVAIETLRSSVEEFQETALDPVAEHAGAHLARITDGRYGHIELDRESMTPTISGNGQTSLSLENLSRGARDQLYLSIRAALIDALSEGRNLPMLLDDPCVNFDEERLANAANLISELARERQILLFTKDETWTRWYDPVLRLERKYAEQELQESS
jgi:uncharacterized protein YhaN